MTVSRSFTIASTVLLFTARALSAQESAQSPSVSAQAPTVVAMPAAPEPVVAADANSQPISLAPMTQNLSVGIRAHAPAAPVPFALPPRDHVSNNVALMIVGGAVLIVGAVVGGTPGTLIMIGGGTVGIIGLIRYLQ